MTYEREQNGWKYNQSIIVINGKGGSGKDTLVEYLSEHSGLKIMNISSIDPIKEILKNTGYWDGEEKSDRVRKMLSDMKKAFEEYNGLSSEYINKHAKFFIISTRDVLFVHIREPEEISKFVKYVEDILKYPVTTLLITSDRTNDKQYGNESDDDVEHYSYDFVYNNSHDIDRSCKLFINFIKGIICA